MLHNIHRIGSHVNFNLFEALEQGRLVAGEELLILRGIIDIDDEPEEFVLVSGSLMHPDAENGMRKDADRAELDDQIFSRLQTVRRSPIGYRYVLRARESRSAFSA